MEITVQELAALDPKGYVLLDMRGSDAREYGSIPGSVGVSPEELSRYNGDRGKKVIIYCARGQVSLDAAIALRERSYDAYSLSGGYLAWLQDEMEKQEAAALCRQVEESIRKRFHSKIWCCFTRAIRGYLYRYAQELGCNKIALGHHYDDVIETILMGMLWGAQVQTMMPKLHSTNFEGMELIRPLYYVREDAIKAWRDCNGLHFIQCACKFTDTCTTCTNNETKSKRMEVKNLIRKMKKTNPGVEAHIFRSMENVSLDAVIAYKTKGRKIHFLDNYDNPDGGIEE